MQPKVRTIARLGLVPLIIRPNCHSGQITNYAVFQDSRCFPQISSTRWFPATNEDGVSRRFPRVPLTLACRRRGGGGGGGGGGYSFKMPGRSQRVALTSGRQGTKAGLSPSTVTPAFVSSFKPACSVVCACLWGCGGCALLPLVLALEVCRRSACFILVLCMRLVVTGGGL